MKTPPYEKLIEQFTVEVGYTNYFAYNPITKHFLCYTVNHTMDPALYDTKDDDNFSDDTTLICDGFVEKCDLENFTSIGVEEDGYTILDIGFDMPYSKDKVDFTYKNGDLYADGEKLAAPGKKGFYVNATTIFNGDQEAEDVWSRGGSFHAEVASRIQQGVMSIDAVDEPFDAQVITHLLNGAKAVIKTKL